LDSVIRGFSIRKCSLDDRPGRLFQGESSPVRGDIFVEPRQKRFPSSVRSGILRRWPTPTPTFSWQEGFGAFSYSRSHLDTVIRYIQSQQKHHERKSFREEYVEMLERFGVAYDQRYIFKTNDE